MSVPPNLKLVWSQAEPWEPTAFDVLLSASEHDPDAAAGLALAYAALRAEEREAIVETVVRDAHAAGRSPAAPLALLLSVESDRALARRIASALVDAGSGELARPGADRGVAWGDAGEGGVAVARYLHGGFIEVLAVAWRADGAVAVRVEPLARNEDLEAVHARLGVPPNADELPLREAVDRLAESLWRARVRDGTIPAGLHGFVDLFEP